MQIGPYILPNPIALAPMAGVSDLPFRKICRELGAGYTVAEMVSANPRLRNSRKTLWRSNFESEPAPIAVQIVGSDPGLLASAARYNVGLGAQIIDINMGCPVKKVCNKLAGSALLSDPALVKRILEAVVAAVDVPVTLKIRTGPDPANRNGVDIAKLAEQCGISALTVHGRTRKDRFRGDAEYQTIRNICRHLSIPVFANGDITTPGQACRVLDYTGADGLMIGRGAQGNPWIFRQITHYLQAGKALSPPTLKETHTVMREHLQQLYRFYGETAGVRIARKHIGWYLQTCSRSKPRIYDLMRVPTAKAQHELLEQYFLNRPKLVA